MSASHAGQPGQIALKSQRYSAGISARTRVAGRSPSAAVAVMGVVVMMKVVHRANSEAVAQGVRRADVEFIGNVDDFG
jgi:hypothetical protein